MAQVLAAPKIPVPKLQRMFPEGRPAAVILKWVEHLEQNQKISSCCRHPENHEVEAWCSTTDEWNAKRTPDIYIFHCTCGRKHRFFCIGGTEHPDPQKKQPRLIWEVR